MESKSLPKKNNKLTIFNRIFLCLLGSVILAFGTGVFLVPANIVSGGVSGIGIIINYFLEPILKINIVDIIVWIINIILLFVSFFVLGKRFALQTLISTIAYPLMLTLFTRTNIFIFISNSFLYETIKGDEFRLFLAGLFGGVLAGTGCAVTFIGGGSTGGLDVLCFTLKKFTGIKESVSSFAFDASIILCGFTITKGEIVPILIGILSAMLSAFMIHIIYSTAAPHYLVDIVTDYPDEINEYVINIFDRTTTTMNVYGGFSKKEKKLVRVVLNKNEVKLLKEAINYIDSKAFIIVVPTNNVLGEGFSILDSGFIKRRNKKRNGK